MARIEWIIRLFHAIDTSDTNTFAGFLTPDALFKFANQEPVVGKEAARQTVAEFLSSIEAIHHDVLDVWEKDGATACHGIVTYTRHDSSQLRVPFANVFKMQGNLIREYLIYVDASQLYAPEGGTS
jgi:ketosteroid isomerase-like protein